MKYFDTSVLILPLLNDHRRKKAIEELESGGITSELGLIELVSYLSRNLNNDIIPYAMRLLKDYNINVKTIKDTRQSFIGELSNVVYVALRVAKDVRLKTLDLLHISYVILFQVDELVTADREFEKASDFLSRKGVTLKVII
ncbi:MULTISPECIES: PIN domain-containing protein [Acidianus]|uniref:type II toxin-antitoxin system VapC family toxin n=1 Tax=Acidianus TaxID=12914 RepID=UPI0009E059BD|nr:MULTISPECIES: PIN domain-containing protein [Acidianus]NON61191.1 PIN domain-containing protein [Acidianus sp. RZ1]